VDDFGENRSGGVGGAVRVPHFLADEASQGPIEAVLLHPLEEGIGDLSFFVGQLLHNMRVDLRVVPVDEKLRGGLMPAVLERVNDYPVVMVVPDPVEHFGEGGVLGEWVPSPLGEANGARGAVYGGGFVGGKVGGGGGSRGAVDRDGFGGNPVPGVGVGGGGGGR